MIKKLLFTATLLVLGVTATLLVPGAAYAANPPSASFTDQVVPAGPGPIACDIGPPYNGSIPAAAAQAGFTHCAANYDFTQTQQWTDSAGTHQWSNLSSWLTCDHNSTNTSYLFYWGGSGTTPCDTSHENIVSDNGTQVLALSIYLNEIQGGTYSTELDTGIFVGSSNITPTPFPEQYYLEQVVKTNTASPSSQGSLYFDISSFMINYVQAPCSISVDFGENFSNTASTNGGIAGWNYTACPTGSGYLFSPAINAPSLTSSSYSTYGGLASMDGLKYATLCNYWAAGAVSGIPASGFQNCIPANYGNPIPVTGMFSGARMYLYTKVGPQSSNNAPGWTANPLTVDIQRMTMWICPNPTGGTNWQTQNTTCFNNPVINTHP
jgi:hypothetical protein